MYVHFCYDIEAVYISVLLILCVYISIQLGFNVNVQSKLL